MIDTNELRKVIADCYWPTSPVAINELLDRLEAAEKENALRERVIDALGSELNAVAKERDALRAKIAEMERQEPVAWTTRLALESVGRGTLGFHACGGNLWGYKGVPLYALPGAPPAPSVPREAIDKMLTQLMDIAVSNGANSISMPDEYVEVAAWLCGIPAQPTPSAPDGYKLVPIEPTQEMINHVIDERLEALVAGKEHTFIDIYKAMLAAAPEAKP